VIVTITLSLERF